MNQLKITCYCIIGCFTGIMSVHAQTQLGTWTDHLNYTQTIDVDVLQEKVYVATTNAVFIYNTADNSLEKINSIHGLSDVGIRTLRTIPDMNMIFIGYQNGNIDLIQGREIYNIPDVKNSAISGDKSIRDICFYEGFAYISTGLGILAFDLVRREIKDTYGIVAGNDLSVNGAVVLRDTMYAGTDQGLYYASMGSDLTIFSNWMADPSVPEPFGNVPHIATDGNNLFINQPAAVQPGVHVRGLTGEWFYSTNTTDVNSMRNTPNGMGITAAYFYQIKAADGITTATFEFGYNGTPSNISKMSGSSDGNIWIADYNFGLVKRDVNNSFEFIAPDGPATNRCFKLRFQQDQLWVASGAMARPGIWDNQFFLSGFYGMVNGTWKNFTARTFPELLDHSFFDLTDVIIDPRDPEHIFISSYYSGLMEIQNGEFVNIYSTDNSTLGAWTNSPRQDGLPWVGVAGLEYDTEGNLWMNSAFSTTPLSVRKADGSWEGFNLQNAVGQTTAVADLIITRDNNKWMIANRTGIIAVEDNAGPDDDIELLTPGTGSGGLPNPEVFSIAEDLDGQIWVGSRDGIAVFFSPFDVFSENANDARQILVEQDGIFQFLFENQAVSTIAIDGANRKWIGTYGSGVFLMSPDGTEQIRKFTIENSPLMSNVINDIVIDPKSGTVFIATDEGVMAYASDATEGAPANECTSVFPNPVRAHYQGSISITGLQRDSEVRITDVRGNLVYSTVSNGGVAVWDGKNLNRERVSTGVYFALSSDVEGASTCVSKILVIK